MTCTQISTQRSKWQLGKRTACCLWLAAAMLALAAPAMAAEHVDKDYVDWDLSIPARLKPSAIQGGYAFDEKNGVVLRVVFKSVSVLSGGIIRALADVDVTVPGEDSGSFEWSNVAKGVPVEGRYKASLSRVLTCYDLAGGGFNWGEKETSAMAGTILLRGGSPAVQVLLKANASVTKTGNWAWRGRATQDAVTKGYDFLVCQLDVKTAQYKGKGLYNGLHINEELFSEAWFESNSSSVANDYQGSFAGDVVMWEEYYDAGDGRWREEKTVGGTITGNGKWYVARSGKPSQWTITMRHPPKGVTGKITSLVAVTAQEASNAAKEKNQPFPDIYDIEETSEGTRRMLDLTSSFVVKNAVVYKNKTVWSQPALSSWIDQVEKDRPSGGGDYPGIFQVATVPSGSGNWWVWLKVIGTEYADWARCYVDGEIKAERTNNAERGVEYNTFETGPSYAPGTELAIAISNGGLNIGSQIVVQNVNSGEVRVLFNKSK